MSDAWNRLAIAAASDLPRRQVLKMAAALFGGSVIAPRLFGAVEAAAPSTQAISLRVRLPGGHEPLLHLPDRFVGKITLPGNGGTYSIVPSIMKSMNRVEVSLYSDSGGAMSLAKRISLPIEMPQRSADANLVSLDDTKLSGWAVAALWARDVTMPVDYSNEDDCSVSCCWGGSASACAVCCDPGNPGCGECCDSGCCPGCS